MSRTRMLPAIALVAVTGMMGLIGCESEDDRLARFAMEANRQQAEQNRDFARLARTTTESHRQMVASVEQSRQELLALEEKLHAQADRIDAERRALANERWRESLLGPVLSSIGMLLVAALPLVLAWYLLAGLRAEEPETAAAMELLIEDLVSERPRLVPQGAKTRVLPVPERSEGFEDPKDSEEEPESA